MTTLNICTRCLKEIPTPAPGSISTGYGLDNDGNKVCYPCCARLDMEYMRNNDRITLYLDMEKQQVTNWPGSLRISCTKPKVGRHNLAGRRYDVWFEEVDRLWHGVQYGDNTELVHCKKLKNF